MKRAFTMSILMLTAACGGGGGKGHGQTTPNADPGGIWKGTDTLTGLSLDGVITEAGTARFIRSDGAQFIGTATTSGNNIAGTYVGYLPSGSTFADGSTHGSGTLSGTLTAGQTATVTFNFTTANNSTSTETITFTFGKLYDTGSSLSAIAGNYTDPSTGDTVSVNASGVVFSQDPMTGCVINGTVAIINASYDVYDVTYSFASCTGSAAFLNGTTATGLGVLDTSVTPTEAIIGVSDTGAGYILTESLTLQ
jgi:hypothetical protein